MLAAGALLAQQVAARATRDALFLSSHDLARLPAAMAAAAMLSLVGVAASSRGMARFGPARVVPAALAASAALLLVEWGVAFVSVPAAAVALYLHVALFGATLVSGFWLLLGELYDPHSAKGALGPVAGGANAGAVLGGGLAWYAGARLGLTAMLPVLAALTVACWMALRSIGAARDSRSDREGPGPSGMSIMRDVPYLRAVAVVVALGAFVEALLDYALSAQAVSRFAAGPPLMAFFSAFHTGVAVAAAALLALAAQPALRRLGIAGTVALRPAAAALGAIVAWSVSGLATAVAARAAEALVRNSLFRTGYELLYLPLPARHRRPVKAIVDVGVDRLGTVAGSVAVLGVLATGVTAARALPAIAAVVAAATVVVALRLKRGYVSSLADSLRTGGPGLEEDATLDTATRFTGVETHMGMDRQTLLREIEAHRLVAGTPADHLSAATATPAAAPTPTPTPQPSDVLLAAAADLRSGDAGRVRAALGGRMQPALVAHAIPLLARDEVAGQAQRALRAVAIRATGQLVDALLDSAHPVVVRRRLAPVIGSAATQRAADGLVLALRDDALEVRARCGRALEAVRMAFPTVALPRETLLAAALREMGLPDPEGRGLRHVFVLLGLCGDAEAMRIAYHAAHSSAARARGTALEYLENVVPDPIRAQLLRRLGTSPTARPAHPEGHAREELLKSAADIVVPDEKGEDL